MPKTILLVDDQLDVRRILERMLSALGYVVLTAASGEEALRVEQANGGVDVLLTDLEMPGMDGRQLARLMRAAKPGLGVLFLSGQLDDLDCAGASTPDGDFLLKPCTMKELADSVSRLIEGLPTS